jgi:carboxymethylenebutenolidase
MLSGKEHKHMARQMVEFTSNGGATRGYLSTPDAGSGPGVIVIQEYWGLVPHIQDICDRFAQEGFVALAPDLFHGSATKEPDEAGKLMMALNIDQAAKDVRGAATYLKQMPQVTSAEIGIVGFCMGGMLAVYGASVSPEIGPVVDFYGVHPSVHPDFARIKGPVLGNFAERDDFVSGDDMRKLESDLQAAGVQTDFRVYPGTHHAFFNDARTGHGESYDAPAAEDSWQRTLSFLHTFLK